MVNIIYNKRFQTIIFTLLIFNIYVFSQSDQIVVRNSILKIAEKLRKEDVVHFGYAVGEAGILETNNKYYKLYLKLKTKATNDELVFLTNDTSKCIIIYSFSILRSRNYDKIKDIFISHLNDTTYYWTAGGCTGFIERVNWFMLRQLKPSNQSSYLTKNEYDMYCNDFKKEDNEFTCE
jgi:hypothetical protein